MIKIRRMIPADIEKIDDSFTSQGWEKRQTVLQNYLLDQDRGERYVFIAEESGTLAGYVTLLMQSKEGPFNRKGIPEIGDFNVFEKFQRKGIGTLLLMAAEEKAKEFSTLVTLGVGLHPGYGPAQRLYVKRGYIPDGSGVWFQNENLAMGAPCCNNDELVLYLKKEL